MKPIENNIVLSKLKCRGLCCVDQRIFCFCVNLISRRRIFSCFIRLFRKTDQIVYLARNNLLLFGIINEATDDLPSIEVYGEPINCQ